MPSSLFRKKGMLSKQDNVNAMFSSLMNSNPQFANFVRENANLTPEQIADKYGVNPDILGRLLNGRR